MFFCIVPYKNMHFSLILMEIYYSLQEGELESCYEPILFWVTFASTNVRHVCNWKSMYIIQL